MNTYSDKLLEIKETVGSYAKVGAICGVSGNAIMKWQANGKPPRTEYTGETDYATLLAESSNGKFERADFLPVPVRRAENNIAA